MANELEDRDQALVNRRRILLDEFALGLTRKYASDKLAAVKTANEALISAGLSANLSLRCRIGYKNNTPVLCCSLSANHATIAEYALTPDEQVAAIQNWEEADAIWAEYCAIKTTT